MARDTDPDKCHAGGYWQYGGRGISNFVGSGLTDGSFNTTVEMLDAGTLVLRGNLTVGDSGTNGASSGNTLDLSGLTNFVYTNITGTFALGVGNRSGEYEAGRRQQLHYRRQHEPQQWLEQQLCERHVHTRPGHQYY